MSDLTLIRRRIGPVRTIADAAIAIRDLEALINSIIQSLDTIENNPDTDIKFFARENDGTFHLYTIEAGAGVTFTIDQVAKICTISSP